ncbi:DNA polymerase III subunit delta [Ruminobacter sp. RM87]|jgi:DNA polymerase-3 subunit delta|uniref:DNA polymerase III subunit delta n=1 Tax=Ruminobacter sp. RM87 TaxID=1200567 RepID=UPI0004E27FCC|nr:DNA polymerase III subunit delta [Ruminobacter sp. RM87]
MKINSYELEGKLKQQIEGVYIFSGNDPFWLDEATATVQNYAVKAGFTKDNIYTFSDDELKTDELIEAMSSPGLFADRVLVKLKIHDLKVKGKKLLEICSECINPSLLLIIHVPRLSLAELNKNKPLLFLADHGIISIFYDPDQRQIIDFIRRRAYSLGLSLNQGATAILYSAYEGNVEGMVQVLQKMELCGLKGEINEEQMREHISSDAHFSAFDYIESLIDPSVPVERRVQIMEVLLENGVTAMELVSRTGSALGTLHEMRTILDTTGSLENYFNNHRLLKSYKAKRNLYLNGARNNSLKELHHLIDLLTKADFLVRNFEDKEAVMVLKEIAVALSKKQLRLYTDD